jgi:hypothetical protein
MKTLIRAAENKQRGRQFDMPDLAGLENAFWQIHFIKKLTFCKNMFLFVIVLTFCIDD